MGLTNNNLPSQSALLDGIVQIMHAEAVQTYRSVSLVSVCDPNEGSADTTFSVPRDGPEFGKHLSPGRQGRIIELVVELYDQMASQTDGAWRSLQVGYGNGGQAKASFVHP